MRRSLPHNPAVQLDQDAGAVSRAAIRSATRACRCRAAGRPREWKRSTAARSGAKATCVLTPACSERYSNSAGALAGPRRHPYCRESGLVAEHLDVAFVDMPPAGDHALSPVSGGYRCLSTLQHRAEAAVPRGSITIFAAIFTGVHCSWYKQSTQCGRHGQCRSGDGHCFQIRWWCLRLLLPPCQRCVLFDPRAQRTRVFPASSHIGVNATHSAAAAVVWVGLPSFLPSARLRTTM